MAVTLRVVVAQPAVIDAHRKVLCPYWQTRSGAKTLPEDGLAQGRVQALAQAHQIDGPLV